MSLKGQTYDPAWMVQQIAQAIALATARTPAMQTRSIVTASNQQGYQIDPTHDALAIYSVTIVTTATIGGNSSGSVVLETCSTNSTVPGDWTEISRVSNAQVITLAVALSSVQTITVNLVGFVPGGYYARIRSIIGSAPVTFSYNDGQEITF